MAFGRHRDIPWTKRSPNSQRPFLSERLRGKEGHALADGSSCRLKIPHWLNDLGESGYAEPEIINRDTTLNQSELCGSTQYKNISKVD